MSKRSARKTSVSGGTRSTRRAARQSAAAGRSGTVTIAVTETGLPLLSDSLVLRKPARWR